MAFTGDYSLTKTPALGLNYAEVEDISDYTDEPKVDFSDRYFYVQKPDGTYIQSPEGTDKWDFGFAAYPDDTRAIEVIDEDMAVIIKMFWIPNTADPGSTYTLSDQFDFLDYFNEWGFNIVLSMAVNYGLAANKNFMQGILGTDTLSAASNLCIENDDAYASQKCIEGIQYVMANPNILY